MIIEAYTSAGPKGHPEGLNSAGVSRAVVHAGRQTVRLGQPILDTTAQTIDPCYQASSHSLVVLLGALLVPGFLLQLDCRASRRSEEK